ncbi:MAG: hypothetical protein LBU87_01925 [Lactobacillales bacterium]|jgi:hypothetical protein|nr:hypothetical protein [Lactobacillales bacterium]
MSDNPQEKELNSMPDAFAMIMANTPTEDEETELQRKLQKKSIKTDLEYTDKLALGTSVQKWAYVTHKSFLDAPYRHAFFETTLSQKPYYIDNYMGNMSAQLAELKIMTTANEIKNHENKYQGAGILNDLKNVTIRIGLKTLSKAMSTTSPENFIKSHKINHVRTYLNHLANAMGEIDHSKILATLKEMPKDLKLETINPDAWRIYKLNRTHLQQDELMATILVEKFACVLQNEMKKTPLTAQLVNRTKTRMGLNDAFFNEVPMTNFFLTRFWKHGEEYANALGLDTDTVKKDRAHILKLTNRVQKRIQYKRER